MDDVEEAPHSMGKSQEKIQREGDPDFVILSCSPTSWMKNRNAKGRNFAGMGDGGSVGDSRGDAPRATLCHGLPNIGARVSLDWSFVFVTRHSAAPPGGDPKGKGLGQSSPNLSSPRGKKRLEMPSLFADGKLARYIEKGKNLSNEYLALAFGHLPTPSLDNLGDQVDMLSISRNIFARRVAHLQERGLIVNTVDFNLSRDNMLA